MNMGTRSSKLCRFFRHHQGSALVAPRGYVPVYVGVGDESKRFMIHLSCLEDADLLELLCKSAEEYGFRNPGVLRIPYDAKRFEERMLVKDEQRVPPVCCLLSGGVSGVEDLKLCR